MLPGFSGYSVKLDDPQFSFVTSLPIARPSTQGVELSDFWQDLMTVPLLTQPGSSRRTVERGITCTTAQWCAGVVQMCSVRCSDGSERTWACGGCLGIGGVSVKLW